MNPTGPALPASAPVSPREDNTKAVLRDLITWLQNNSPTADGPAEMAELLAKLG